MPRATGWFNSPVPAGLYAAVCARYRESRSAAVPTKYSSSSGLACWSSDRYAYRDPYWALDRQTFVQCFRVRSLPVHVHHGIQPYFFQHQEKVGMVKVDSGYLRLSKQLSRERQGMHPLRRVALVSKLAAERAIEKQRCYRGRCIRHRSSCS